MVIYLKFVSREGMILMFLFSVGYVRAFSWYVEKNVKWFELSHSVCGFIFGRSELPVTDTP